MLISIGEWAGAVQDMGPATRALLHWVTALIALPAIVLAGMPFYRAALAALRRGRSNMDVPISLGVLLVSGISLADTFGDGAHTYFESALMLLFFLLLGRVLDHRARGRARATAEQLLLLRAGDVAVLDADGGTTNCAQEQVAPGARVLVGMGERIGIDGVVETGAGAVDASLVTGESLPVAVAPGAAVFAGTLNLGAALVVRATATGAGTLLAECVRLIEAAEARRGRFVVLADRVARAYAPAVHGTALVTFLGWVALGAPVSQALLIASAVLIVTCPCSVALAVPAVQVIAAGRLFRAGVLLKSATALERLAEVDTVVFDKTGTLSAPALALAAGGGRRARGAVGRRRPGRGQPAPAGARAGGRGGAGGGGRGGGGASGRGAEPGDAGRPGAAGKPCVLWPGGGGRRPGFFHWPELWLTRPGRCPGSLRLRRASAGGCRVPLWRGCGRWGWRCGCCRGIRRRRWRGWPPRWGSRTGRPAARPSRKWRGSRAGRARGGGC